MIKYAKVTFSKDCCHLPQFTMVQEFLIVQSILKREPLGKLKLSSFSKHFGIVFNGLSCAPFLILKSVNAMLSLTINCRQNWKLNNQREMNSLIYSLVLFPPISQGQCSLIALNEKRRLNAR